MNILKNPRGWLATALLLPASAMAHPGAGHVSGFLSGLGHPFGGADHLLAMLAVGLWAAQMGGRAAWGVPAAFVSLMLMGGALGMAGIALPWVEQGILLSVLVLGILIAGSFSFSVAVSACIVGFFALCHGYAHGVEMPSAIAAISYSAGFALSTALLHGFGIGVTTLVRRQYSRLAGAVIALSGVWLAILAHA